MAEDNLNLESTMKETDRKCPQCGGTMDYDPSTGGLKCPYCEYTEEIPQEASGQAQAQGGSAQTTTANGKAAELSLLDAEKVENSDWGLSTKTVICKSCGAESVYDAHVVSAECPYCGSNQVMEAGGENIMAPGGVIPFKISKENASERFRNWIGHKFFAPKLAKQSAKAESFKGLYLPYWTFDANTSTTYTAEFGRDRRVKDKEGNEQIVTDWFNTQGRYDQFYNDELVCGTKQHDNSMLRGIEPYDTEDNKAYKPEYVAGFGAEKYTIGIKEAWEIAKNFILSKIKAGITDKVTREENADHVRNINSNSNFFDLTYKYLLLPVWISSFTYNGKVYQFMVNGQTGKVSGKSPVSAIKVILTIIIAIIILWLLFGGCSA